MTGDKPDEMLRTPMQWTGEAGGGFTRGTPWEPLQKDAAVVTVAAQQSDSGSLLSMYKRLIRLRATNSALSSGELIPVRASSDAVLAYVRRDVGRSVLVVSNLGTTALNGVALSSEGGALRVGRYGARPLFGVAPSAEMTVAADGRFANFLAVPTLAPMQTYVLALTPIR